MIKKEDIKSFVNKRVVIISLLVCIVIALAIIIISLFVDSSKSEGELFGVYEYDDCVYMTPISSFMPIKEYMTEVYVIDKGSLIIGDVKTGHSNEFSARYEKKPINEDEFLSMSNFGLDSELFGIPDLSQYKERWLLAIFSGSQENKLKLYRMDGDIWLASFHGSNLWSIFRLKKSEQYNLEELQRAFNTNMNKPESLKQMTLKDVYNLAQIGEELTLNHFKEFDGNDIGSGFIIKRFEIEGRYILIAHCASPESKLNYARLTKQGYDPFDESNTVDIMAGRQAVAAYLNPLNSLSKLKIEDPHNGGPERELIYEFDGYRYYLNSTRADQVYITFDYGERIPLKQALEERRTIIEELVAKGLYNVYMEPVENPLGGQFSLLHHMHRFYLDEDEFYPSPSFMYTVFSEAINTYFDIAELAGIMELWGRDDIADKLYQLETQSNLSVIAGRIYIQEKELSDAGVSVKIGWELSSHTPVTFTTK